MTKKTCKPRPAHADLAEEGEARVCEADCEREPKKNAKGTRYPLRAPRGRSFGGENGWPEEKVTGYPSH